MIDDNATKITIDDIKDAVREYQPNSDIDLIQKAYDLAYAAHFDQKRASGEHYIIHPLHVAAILTQMHIDEVTIAAALLHDVVEDTTFTLDEMKKKFGEEVALLIDGVTKLNKIHFKSKEMQQSENYRKMFLAMAKDIRVIMIKLADRLHNMRTLKYMPEEKQKRIAKETLEIYAPLANRLGISNIKWELEDLCFRYLYPEEYYDLVEKVKQKRQERQKFIDDSVQEMVTEIKKTGIKAEIQGRAKHFYSIWRKMKRDNKDISEIYDLSAVRVLVNTVQECYTILGIIHNIWKPIPGRFKDYIAMPKSNGYQSLHTTVIAANGYPLEIQIRTFQMHQVSEYGIAAHWKYKESGKSINANNAYDQKLSWLRQLISLQTELSDPDEYVEALKVDIFSDEVFVFTPRGDVIGLPKGSNPIDFAYRIHTDIGNHCVGAKINGKIVPLEYKLKNGDIVSVITNNQNNGPSPDWLNIVASSETRTKIRQWFKRQKREENIASGLALIEKGIKHLGYDPRELLKDDRLAVVARDMNIQQNANDLLASLGYGGITVNGVISRLIELYKKDLKEITPPDVSQMLEQIKPHGEKKKGSHGILIEGESGFLVHLARCCNPIPGDPIIGYITRGRGVSVHRADCPNIIKDENDLSRVVDVSWDIGLDKTYTVTIDITCNDSPGVLTSLMAIPSESKINIHSMTARPNKKNKTSTISMSLEIRSIAQAETIMSKIRRNKNVFRVARALNKPKGTEGD
ncbi:RelA/SpoT family protein [Pectinatus frisingensis]|uniref:RelA/SpoT family protein n=1 Tax=Pectinatus frisingensis TaxID=865 RepID=UPI0018C53D31|nr:bifunctional (p)ppGpp synthetase/guanosine-3',5'-bis(diphosphate) 3'-pyrophosphohydrolase [Pectinatus frisingensis]